MNAARKSQVVLVEDNVPTRARVVKALESDGRFEVAGEASSVAEAVTLFARLQPDVLIVDLGLPDGNGIDVIALARRTFPACEIMVLTMFGDERNVLLSIEAGATGYLLKDTPGPAIPDAVQQLLEGGAPMSPPIARQVLTRVRSPDRREARPGPKERATAPERTSAAMHDETAITLSPREGEVLDLIARGYRYEEVGRLLDISLATVQSHIRSIYGKLAVHSRSEAVFEAMKLGLLQQGLFRPDR